MLCDVTVGHDLGGELQPAACSNKGKHPKVTFVDGPFRPLRQWPATALLTGDQALVGLMFQQKSDLLVLVG